VLPKKANLSVRTITPEDATKLLEHNRVNRPLRQGHVDRISRLIQDGAWRFNGDTIKIADTGDVLDGQHRLWAVIDANCSIETIVVQGIAKEAFSTIDTIRQSRTGADVLALKGISRYRTVMSSGLAWLLRFNRSVIVEWKLPKNKIENSDIEGMAEENPDFVKAVGRVMCLRGLTNPSIFSFLYFVISNRNYELAERMINTLENPEGVAISDPFYRLRSYLTSDHHKRKDPLMTIALTIKAINFANEGKKIQTLSWRAQGKNAEPYPTISVRKDLK